MSTSVNQRFLDALISAFSSKIEKSSNDIDRGVQQNFDSNKLHLEMYGFLVAWAISTAEQKTMAFNDAKKASAPIRGKKKSLKKSPSDDDDEWDWLVQKKKVLASVQKLLGLRLNDLWMSTAERDRYIKCVAPATPTTLKLTTDVSMFTKVIYRDLMENQDNMKNTHIKQTIFAILCICIKEFNHAFGS